MVMHDKYLELKKLHNDTLIMIKVGNFYHIYDEDAIIMFYLFKYKISDNKVGFPVRSLDKVINKLTKNSINYYIDESNSKCFDNNNYLELLDKSKLYYELNLEIDDIYTYLISNIERKYIKRIISKIKDVIDEG